ncbi:Mitogen-activated protein kinase kinase kinase 9 [Geodia barretti]|nr:Mitogen-activated protein kinase kinase kinase 9 [Geodia barretti]
MTGAGTYPWMAPEVIISNDFSTKCDVWSYGVVLWELLTGEKPYGNLNAFVVAYGVGRGTLSLPIPAGCPESFQELMSACWQKEHTKRPPFTEILDRLKNIELEEFMSSTSFDDFLSIQSTWKTEIQEQFLKFKREESAFKEQELPGDLAKRIKQQEEKIQQQQHELEKLRTDTKQAQEEWQRRRELEQNEAFQRQREELERLKEKLREMERRRENNPASPAQQQQSRPPRVKRFSARRLLKWLSGTDSQKTSSKLQQQKSTSSSSAATTAHPSVQYSTASDRRASLQPPRRATSNPSTSPPESRRPSSLIDDVTTTSSIPGMLVVNKRTSLPHKFRERDAAPGAGVGEGGRRGPQEAVLWREHSHVADRGVWAADKPHPHPLVHCRRVGVPHSAVHGGDAEDDRSRRVAGRSHPFSLTPSLPLSQSPASWCFITKFSQVSTVNKHCKYCPQPIGLSSQRIRLN